MSYMAAKHGSSSQSRRLSERRATSVSFSRDRDEVNMADKEFDDVDDEDDDDMQISLAPHIQAYLAHSNQRVEVCGIFVPVPFERAARTSWWYPKFDSEILEDQYRTSAFPQIRLRFRYCLIYIVLVSVTWCVYLLSGGGGGEVYPVGVTFGLFAMFALLVLLLTRLQLFNRLHVPVAVATTLVMYALSLVTASSESALTPAGDLALCIEVLTLVYTVVPLPLYACVVLNAGYSVAFEWVARPGSSVAARLLCHCAAHFVGVHTLIMTDVRMRGTFMKVGQSLLVRRQLELEKQLKEKMIHSVMPPKVAAWLMSEAGRGRRESRSKDDESDGEDCSTSDSDSEGGSDIHSLFRPFNMLQMENVSILFADIVGFTRMSSNKTAAQLVALLNDLFERFDGLCADTGCEKISTLGDCYYCVAGCPQPRPDHAVCCMEMGLKMITAIGEFDRVRREGVNMRVGVHTGTVLCGIVGTRRVKFDVWSNDVRLANKMESTGQPGRVHLSHATRQFLPADDRYVLEDGPVVEVCRCMTHRLLSLDLFVLRAVQSLLKVKIEHYECDNVRQCEWDRYIDLKTYFVKCRKDDLEIRQAEEKVEDNQFTTAGALPPLVTVMTDRPASPPRPSTPVPLTLQIKRSSLAEALCYSQTLSPLSPSSPSSPSSPTTSPDRPKGFPSSRKKTPAGTSRCRSPSLIYRLAENASTKASSLPSVFVVDETLSSSGTSSPATEKKRQRSSILFGKRKTPPNVDCKYSKLRTADVDQPGAEMAYKVTNGSGSLSRLRTPSPEVRSGSVAMNVLHDQISVCPSINSRKDSGIRSNSRRSSIQQQLFTMNGIMQGELLTHRVSGYYTSSQSTINDGDRCEHRKNLAQLPAPFTDDLGVCFQKLRKQSDLQLIRCVQDNSMSQRSYFVQAPLSNVTLFFKHPALEKEFRKKAYKSFKNDAATLATARFNTYLDIAVCLLVMSLLTVTSLLLFPATDLWLTVAATVWLIQIVAVGFCLHSLFRPTRTTPFKRCMSWYPWHYLGGTLVSMPIVLVLANFGQSIQSSDSIYQYSCLLYIGLIHFCNFTQLNCWMKSILATLFSIVYICLVTIHIPTTIPPSALSTSSPLLNHSIPLNNFNLDNISNNPPFFNDLPPNNHPIDDFRRDKQSDGLNSLMPKTYQDEDLKRRKIEILSVFPTDTKSVVKRSKDTDQFGVIDDGNVKRSKVTNHYGVIGDGNGNFPAKDLHVQDMIENSDLQEDLSTGSEQSNPKEDLTKGSPATDVTENDHKSPNLNLTNDPKNPLPKDFEILPPVGFVSALFSNYSKVYGFGRSFNGSVPFLRDSSFNESNINKLHDNKLDFSRFNSSLNFPSDTSLKESFIKQTNSNYDFPKHSGFNESNVNKFNVDKLNFSSLNGSLNFPKDSSLKESSIKELNSNLNFSSNSNLKENSIESNSILNFARVSNLKDSDTREIKIEDSSFKASYIKESSRILNLGDSNLKQSDTRESKSNDLTAGGREHISSDFNPIGTNLLVDIGSSNSNIVRKYKSNRGLDMNHRRKRNPEVVTRESKSNDLNSGDSEHVSSDFNGTSAFTKTQDNPDVPEIVSMFLVEIYLDVILLLLLVWFLNREFEISYRLSYHGNAVAARDKERVQAMKDQADWLLHNIIPQHVAEHLKNTARYSENVENAGILFASIVNFSEMYDESYLGGRECLRVLNELISDFDELLDSPRFSMVEKIKTIGSSYMAASGLNPDTRQSSEPDMHLYQLMEFAISLQEVINSFNRDLLEFNLIIRIGFNYGDVTAGVIGTSKLYYDIWGDAVNIASRMDSIGMPGRIQVPGACLHALSRWYDFTPRGQVYVKGKDLMNVYLLIGPKAASATAANTEPPKTTTNDCNQVE